jgi:hypothetical protein
MAMGGCTSQSPAHCGTADTRCAIAAARLALAVLPYRFTVALTADSPQVDSVLKVLDPATKEALRRLMGAPPGSDDGPATLTVSGHHDTASGAVLDAPSPAANHFDPQRLLDGAGAARLVAQTGGAADNAMQYTVTLDPAHVDETMVISALHVFSAGDTTMRIQTATADVWVDGDGRPVHVRLTIHGVGQLSWDVTADVQLSAFATP